MRDGIRNTQISDYYFLFNYTFFHQFNALCFYLNFLIKNLSVVFSQKDICTNNVNYIYENIFFVHYLEFLLFTLILINYAATCYILSFHNSDDNYLVDSRRYNGNE